jgi:hypothetical protein
VEEDWVEDWISGHKESDHLLHPRNGSHSDPTYSLYAMPAEENFSGRLYPLRQIREVQVRVFLVYQMRYRRLHCSLQVEMLQDIDRCR